MAFEFERLAIPDVVLIKPEVHADVRGHFMETFKSSEFAAFGIDDQFVQENHSHSQGGVLRGLHYQNPPRGQAKLIRIVVGRIFDVVVDIRKGSPTFGRWISTELSEDDRQMLYVPIGFAHGFYTLSETADLVYKVTEEHSLQHETGILWNDGRIGIDWPSRNPLVSAKDAALPSFEASESRFVYCP